MSDSMEGDTSEDSEDQPEKNINKRKMKQKHKQAKKNKQIEESNQEITDDEYRVLLQEISNWHDKLKSISMLKVLYRDHVTDAHTLHNATKMRDLLDNLHVSGKLSPSDLGILYDTINLTKQFAFKPTNKNLLPLFQNVKEIVISKFILERQKLVRLGMALTPHDVVKLDGEYNMPLNRYEDSWQLIQDLENRGEIYGVKLKAFIQILKKLKIHQAVEALTEDIGNASSNSGQTRHEDIENASSGQASGQVIPSVSLHSAGPSNEGRFV